MEGFLPEYCRVLVVTVEGDDGFVPPSRVQTSHLRPAGTAPSWHDAVLDKRPLRAYSTAVTFARW